MLLENEEPGPSTLSKKTELTEGEKKEMETNVAKATKLFQEVLDYDVGGKHTVIDANVVFLGKRLAKAQADRIEASQQLVRLNQHFMKVYEQIQALDIPADARDEKIRRLYQEQAAQREVIEGRGQALDGQVIEIQKRLEQLRVEANALPRPEPKPVPQAKPAEAAPAVPPPETPEQRARRLYEELKAAMQAQRGADVIAPTDGKKGGGAAAPAGDQPKAPEGARK
jgi:hypothetical protein